MSNIKNVTMKLSDDTEVKVKLIKETVLKYQVIDTDLLNNNTVLNDTNNASNLNNNITITEDGTEHKLIKMLKVPHNNLVFMLWLDTIDNELYISPDLNPYKDMKYIVAKELIIKCYPIKFSENININIPNIKNTANPKCISVSIPSYVNVQNKGQYFEKMVSSDLNYSSVSIYASGMIDLGTPGNFFESVGFLAPINVLGYDSLFEFSSTEYGTQKLEDIGHLVVQLPL